MKKGLLIFLIGLITFSLNVIKIEAKSENISTKSFVNCLIEIKDKVFELAKNTYEWYGENKEELKEVSKEVYKKYIKQGVTKFAKGVRVMSNIDQTLLNAEEKEMFRNIDNLINEMYRTSENNLLKAQFLIGDVKKKKELAE